MTDIEGLIVLLTLFGAVGLGAAVGRYGTALAWYLWDRRKHD